MSLDPTQQQSPGGPSNTALADLASCVTGLTNTLAKGMAGQMTAYGLVPMEFALLRLFLARDEWTTTELALDIHRRVQAYIERLSEGVSEEEMAAFISTTSKVMASYDAMAQATRS